MFSPKEEQLLSEPWHNKNETEERFKRKKLTLILVP